MSRGPRDHLAFEALGVAFDAPGGTVAEPVPGLATQIAQFSDRESALVVTIRRRPSMLTGRTALEAAINRVLTVHDPEAELVNRSTSLAQLERGVVRGLEPPIATVVGARAVELGDDLVVMEVVAPSTLPSSRALVDGVVGSLRPA